MNEFILDTPQYRMQLAHDEYIKLKKLQSEGNRIEIPDNLKIFEKTNIYDQETDN